MCVDLEFRFRDYSGEKESHKEPRAAAREQPLKEHPAYPAEEPIWKP